MAADSEDLISHITAQIADAVKAGRTPDEAARRLALIVPSQQVQLALDAYRARAKRIREKPSPAGVYNRVTDPWYLGPDEDDKFWPGYRRHLIGKGWRDDSIDALDGASTRVVALLEPPSRAKIDTRGLVVGYVQSGKTANFTAVIAKAADVGYRFFVILSGLNNALRLQTQLRLGDDLVSSNPDFWIWLTEPTTDFRARENVNAFLGARHSQKVLAVVKKNPARLRRLISWLKDARAEVLRACPILIIDDEADQASPNAHRDPSERTTINQLIIKLLDTVPKAGYVGYTATPFANLLIDPSVPEDLYPRNFIMDIPASDGYFGAAEIFGRAPIDEDDDGLPGLDVIRTVTDAEAARMKPITRLARYDFKPVISDSLEKAILYFLLATSARLYRGHRTQHSSMLVHTTQYSVAHNNSAQVVSDYLGSVRARFMSAPKSLADELEVLWNEEQEKLPSKQMGLEPVSFSSLWKHFQETLDRCEVKVENGVSSDRIDYENCLDGVGRIYVVIGGNVLSRGLTLEGLVVSFFVRSASAYDTLLQMGRWFGYRRGYQDLPRVWLTKEIEGFFYDMASVERELRVDINRYTSGEITPLDFGVRIRTHPSLAITNSLKMQSAVPAKMAFNGRYVQTIVFDESASVIESNRQAANALLRAISHVEKIAPITLGGRPAPIFRDVSVERILKFLADYSVDNLNASMPASLMIEYIKAQNKFSLLLKWNVAVVTRRKAIDTLGKIDLEGVGEIPLISRARFMRDRPPQRVDIKALMSESDVAIDVDRKSTEIRKMHRDKLLDLRDQDVPDRGLLLLYPIAKNSLPMPGSFKRAPLDVSDHLIGLALVFPQVSNDHLTPQSYVTAPLPNVGVEEFEIDDLADSEEIYS